MSHSSQVSHQPLEIPCIDFSVIQDINLAHITEEHAQWLDPWLQNLYHSLRHWGFFYLTGHQIPISLQQTMQQQARLFFHQDLSDKIKIDMSRRGRAWRGYFAEGVEKTAGQSDYKEGLYFGTDHPDHHPNREFVRSQPTRLSVHTLTFDH